MMNRVSRDNHTDLTGCVAAKAVFQHPLIEEPPTARSSTTDRSTYTALTSRAAAVCAACPLAKKCLYDAVVNFDVDGYVAGTTRKQRNQMRELLQLSVAAEDFDTLAGVTASHRQVDHDEVLRIRQADPNKTLEAIAQQLGCSLSTVKRHLRKARETKQASVTSINANSNTGGAQVSMRQVAEAYVTVTRQATAAATHAA